jgi:gliding motility-associated-like protein
MLCLSVLAVSSALAQCPPNIGFEEGSFNHWECHAGAIDTVGGITVGASGPMGDRHTILKKSAKQELDFYGKFPVNCPNGSGYSIRLGNNSVGAEAEAVSYTFKIPAGQDVFSLIYNYAVVFQNPGHSPAEQPKFTAKVYDVTSGKYITCSSFDFTASGDLPGFESVGDNVLYKPWSAVTIKLAGYAGKTIRLEFTTNDCTKGGHFGYAYLDIDENCTSPIQGNTYCLDAKSVNLVAPFGYKEYRWYDSAFNKTLGTSNTLSISPLPSPGTKYALEVFPYPGSGCVDTLYTIAAVAPVPLNFSLAPSVETCAPGTINLQDAKLRQGSSAGLTFSYYRDSSLQEYLNDPSSITKSGIYYIRANNSYGCKESKPIKALIREQPRFNVVSAVKEYWPNAVDITKRSLLSGDLQGLNFSYWTDQYASNRLYSPTTISASGAYFIKATDGYGCSSVRSINVSITPPPPANAFSPNADGINDVWLIPGLAPYPNCTVDVYNRYGQLVFHSFGYKKPWDGTLNGKRLPIDTYYYVIKLSNEAGSLSGTITLLQ